MVGKVKFGLAISEEVLGEKAPVIFQGGIENGIIRASELGFESVEIHIRNPDNFKAVEIKDIAFKNKIKIAAVGTGLEYSKNGLCFTSPDKSVRQRTRERIKEHIDFASVFGAVVFLGMLRGSSPEYSLKDKYLNRLHEELLPVAAYAKKKNVPLGFEPIAFYLCNLLNSTKETVDFLGRPGLESIGILFDTHHMFIEDKSIEESIKMCEGKIVHVHMSDSNRRYPGCGNGDFVKTAEMLKQINYGLSLSLECLPVPDPETAALKGLKALRTLWL